MKVLNCNTVRQFTYSCVASFVKSIYYPDKSEFYLNLNKLCLVKGQRITPNWGRPTATYIWVKSYVTTGCVDALV